MQIFSYVPKVLCLLLLLIAVTGNVVFISLYWSKKAEIVFLPFLLLHATSHYSKVQLSWYSCTGFG